MVALADGTYTFLARIEQSSNSAVFGQPSSSVSDPIDTTPPAQVIRSITATSDLAPFAIGVGNDPTPTITVTLDFALGTGESLDVMRAVGTGAPQTVASFTSASGCIPSGLCFQFTDSTGVSIPLPPARRNDPLTAATTPNPALQTATYTYSARVRDGAGNQGSNTGSVSLQLGHLDCDKARASATGGTNHPPVSTTDSPGTNCSLCHRTQPANSSPNGTPVGTFVASPRGDPSPSLPSTYWCRRPI
jgi:hypothetical protein